MLTTAALGELAALIVDGDVPSSGTCAGGRRSDRISSVVPSAAEGRPIVAFAAPFDTPTGRRVFSGGYDLRRNTRPIRENQAGPAEFFRKRS